MKRAGDSARNTFERMLNCKLTEIEPKQEMRSTMATLSKGAAIPAVQVDAFGASRHVLRSIPKRPQSCVCQLSRVWAHLHLLARVLFWFDRLLSRASASTAFAHSAPISVPIAVPALRCIRRCLARKTSASYATSTLNHRATTPLWTPASAPINTIGCAATGGVS